MKIKHLIGYTATAAVALGIGAATASPSEPVAPPAAVTRTVSVTPPSCREALDDADKAFTIAADTMSGMSDAISAITRFDQTATDAAMKRIDASTAKLTALQPRYKAAEAACR